MTPDDSCQFFMFLGYITCWCVSRRERMGCWGLLGLSLINYCGSFPHSLRLAPASLSRCSWLLGSIMPGCENLLLHIITILWLEYPTNLGYIMLMTPILVVFKWPRPSTVRHNSCPSRTACTEPRAMPPGSCPRCLPTEVSIGAPFVSQVESNCM